MTANQRDLWPIEITLEDEPQSPLAILKEQASLLGRKTGNVVEAKVSSDYYEPSLVRELKEYGFKSTQMVPSDEGSYFVHSFSLTAPALGGYRYKLFEVIHPVTPYYPLEIRFSDREIKAENEEQFVERLKTIFADEKTLKVINSLRNQSALAGV